MGNNILKLLLFGPVVEEMPLKEKVYLQHTADDGCLTTD